jgi:hypothetical protein
MLARYQRAQHDALTLAQQRRLADLTAQPGKGRASQGQHLTLKAAQPHRLHVPMAQAPSISLFKERVERKLPAFHRSLNPMPAPFADVPPMAEPHAQGCLDAVSAAPSA